MDQMNTFKGMPKKTMIVEKTMIVHCLPMCMISYSDYHIFMGLKVQYDQVIMILPSNKIVTRDPLLQQYDNTIYNSGNNDLLCGSIGILQIHNDEKQQGYGC